MPLPIDPSGFNIYARLVVADDGGVFNLWMNGAEEALSPARGVDFRSIYRGTDTENRYLDLPIIESVSIELNLGLNGKVNMEIGAPFDLGLALLESQLFTIGNVIQVQLSYPKLGRSTGWFGGMNAKPSVRIDPDNGLSATLNIEGAGFAAIRTVSSEPFENYTYQEIIRSIADANNWRVKEPAAGNYSADNPDPYTAARVTVSQGNLSDFTFLQHVTRQAELDFFLGPHPDEVGISVVNLQRRDEALGRQPKYTFVARGKSNFIDTFPLLSFESQAEGVWLPRGTGLLRSSDINPLTRDPDLVEASQETSSVTASAPAQVGEGSTEVDGVTVAARRPSDPQTAGDWYAASCRDPMTPLERMRSHSTEEAMRGGINATMSSFGIPDLVPGDVIRIEELGVFSGNYGVQGVSHQAAAGEWTMSMTLLSNAAAVGAISTALGREPPSFTREEPETSTEAEGDGEDREATEVGEDGSTFESEIDALESL